MQSSGETPEEALRALVEGIDHALWLMDARTGGVLYVSPRCGGMHGRPLESLRDAPWPWEGAVLPEDRPAVLREWERARGAGASFDVRYRVVQADGSRRWIRARASPLRDAGRYAGLMEDVTEAVEAEAAARRAEKQSALRTLVAGIAHEVNNPLTYSLGGVEMAREDLAGLLQDPDMDDRARAVALSAVEGLDRSLHGLNQIARVTKGLRLVAWPGYGRRRPTHLNGVVGSVLLAAASRIGRSTVVATDLRAKGRPLANEEELGQAILNLVVNAADAVGSREGRIEVRTRDEGDRVLVEVADTGDGIPAEVQRKLFEPFFTTKPGGTGLGLSISHRIAANHGARITYETAPGRGTTFTFTLPAA